MPFSANRMFSLSDDRKRIKGVLTLEGAIYNGILIVSAELGDDSGGIFKENALNRSPFSFLRVRIMVLV